MSGEAAEEEFSRKCVVSRTEVKNPMLALIFHSII